VSFRGGRAPVGAKPSGVESPADVRTPGPIALVLAALVGCGPTAGADASGDGGASGEAGGGTTSASQTSEGGTAPAGECAALEVIEGSVVIGSPADIALYDCVVEIGGGVELEGVEMVELAGFPRLERVGGTVFVAWTATLVSITGFPELRQVESVIIYEHDALERIDGFGKLEIVTGSLRLEGLPALATIDGLAGVTSVGERLFLRDVPVLPHLGALASVAHVGDTLEIDGCDALVDLTGLGAIDPLPTTRIQRNAGLLALTGLAATSAEGLVVSDNDALVDLAALGQLATIEGSLEILGNGALTSLDGLATLQLVGEELAIVDNDALVQIAEPRVPATIGRVKICENDLLADLPAPMSASVDDVMVIRNRALPNDDALAFATALGHPDAKIAGNADLASYPVEPCPFVGDGVCDEPELASGDLVAVCDPATGEGCCEWGGPTGLCMLEGEGEPDCPDGIGFPG
jgi:hypothetical protein